MRTTTLIALLAVAATLATPAIAQKKESPMLKPEEFVILPWSWAQDDADYMKSIKDCGFNLAGIVAADHLSYVKKVGLKAIVWDESVHASDRACQLDAAEIDKRVRELAKKIKGRPEAFGVYLRDEPSAAVYGGLAAWSAAVRKRLPGLVPYINLFPNYANEAQLGARTYAQYLDQFVETVKPPFISYDHYALMDDGTVREGYFQNLEAVRHAAITHNLPFWNIVLSNSHFHYAEPSDAGLRFQAYTTLAYGARGLCYFTYIAPEVGNYRLAPLDQFGHKTPTWSMLRNVNLQVHKLGPTYIKLTSVNVFHYPEAPEGCHAPDSAVHVASLSGGQFVVGEFTSPDGAPYAMVVNKSLTRSAALGITFKQPGKVMMVNPYTGADQEWAGENGWLAPGQGMLLFVKK